MSMPDYIISRAVIEDRMSQQFAHDERPERPEEPRPSRHGTTTMLRLRLSTALRTAAAAIEPKQPVPDCLPGQQA